MISQYQIWKYHFNLEGNQWEAFNRYVKEYGPVCGGCGKNYIPDYKGDLICFDCVSSSIDWTDNPEVGTSTIRHYVYALINNGKVTYVGVSNNPRQRIQAHLKDKNFDNMSILKGFSDRKSAARFEKAAIYTLQPTLNRLVVKVERIHPRWQEAIDRYRMEKV